MEALRASSAVDARHQQPEASTSGTNREGLRDAASIALCVQAVQMSCLLPFLDRQLENASFNDMASRWVFLQDVVCTSQNKVPFLHGMNMSTLCSA